MFVPHGRPERSDPAGASTPGGAGSSPYLAGIDGIRALAVAAVVLFHSAAAWPRGGFLGVEVFFVLSGFLITRGLLGERGPLTRTLPRFWGRRARRLLPALFLVLVGSLLWVEVADPDRLPDLRSDVLAACLYATNWQLVLDGRSYFDTFAAPSPLRHLWSLAIEEQFYLIWPVIAFGALQLGGRRLLAAVVVAGAVASWIAMAWLSSAAGDTSRVYYGTDTRAGGLLLGAALALHTGRWSGGASGDAGWPRDLLGLGGLTGLAVCFLTFGETRSSLYPWGLIGTGLATCGVLIAAASPGTRTARAFGAAPLRWLGTRSYGVYLWHWPLLVFAGGTGADAAALPSLAAILATLLLAEASYRWVEMPVRRGALGAGVRRLRTWPTLPAARRAGLFASALGVAFAATAVGWSAATADREPMPEYVAHGEVRLVSRSATVPFEADGAAVPSERGIPEALDLARVPQLDPALDPGGEPPDETTTAAEIEDLLAAVALPPFVDPRGPRPHPPARHVSAIGDSVMLGAAWALVRSGPSIDVDAAVGRQVFAAVDALRSRAAAGDLGDVVVVHLGNNGTFRDAEFDEIMEIVGPERRVVFVTVAVPRPWEEGNNEVLSRGVARWANAELADWHALSDGKDLYFIADGVHLEGEGIAEYVALIAAYL